MICGAQNHEQIFQIHGDQQRPCHHGQNSQNKSLIDWIGMAAMFHAGFQRIQRTGSNVAKDNANSRERKRGGLLGSQSNRVVRVVRF